jgi:hypothetical protein
MSVGLSALGAAARGGEYKRIALDSNIIAQGKDVASVRNMMVHFNETINGSVIAEPEMSFSLSQMSMPNCK